MLLVLLLTTLVLARDTGMWQKSGTNARLSSTGVVLDDFGTTLVTCAVTCLRHLECVAFNYHDGDSRCQLLNTASHEKLTSLMVTEDGWNYYTQKYINTQRIRDPCASSPCPTDSACVRYEQPVWQKYNNSLDFYACTRHSWIMDQTNANKQCHFKIEYSTDYQYANTEYYGVHRPFYEAFKNCLTYNCAALICVGSYPCFIKNNFHEIEGKLIHMATAHYWYPVCK